MLITHSLFLLMLFTWCVDTQDPLVPARRLHSQHLILTGELNLGVAASRLVSQKNEHLRRALPNRQHSELQCNQCKGCFVEKRNGLRLTRWVSHPAWNPGWNHHRAGSVGSSWLHLFWLLPWSWWFTCQWIDVYCWGRQTCERWDTKLHIELCTSGLQTGFQMPQVHS